MATLSTKGEFAIQATFDPKTSDEEIDRRVQNASQCVVHAMGENISHTVVDVSAYNMHTLNSTKCTHLLDSFEMERRPIADSTRRFAFTLGTPIISSFMRRIQVFFVSNPVTRFILGRILGGSMSALFSPSNDLVLGFQYSNSTIVLHEYDSSGDIKLNQSSVNEFVPSSLPGCCAPHVVLPDCDTILNLRDNHRYV